MTPEPKAEQPINEELKGILDRFYSDRRNFKLRKYNAYSQAIQEIHELFKQLHPTTSQDGDEVDAIILDLVHQGSMLPPGKTINAGMFPEAKAAIQAYADKARLDAFEWHEYTGKYTKQYYDVKLWSGEVYEDCWPNANTFHEGVIGKMILGKDVAYIRAKGISQLAPKKEGNES